MSIKSYTDIIIDGDQFSIKPLSVTEKENKYHAGLALITLDRIQEVIQRGLTYLSTTADDSYSKMSPDELREELKKIAESIKADYLEKSQHLSYARRFFGGVAQEEEGIQSAYEHIEKLVAQRPVLDLPNELIEQICGLLQNRDLGRLAQVNQHAVTHANYAEMQRAQESGYKGNDFAEAKDYLKNRQKNLQNLLIQGIDTLVKEGVIPETYFVRRGLWPFWRHVDSEATLRNIKHLSEDQAAGLKVELNQALLRYSKDGNAAACHALPQLGANIETPDNNGLTPLALAAWEGKKEVVEVLIQNGANVNSKDKRGDTPLTVAIWYPDIIRLLLENGAVDSGKKALHCAASQGQTETVKLLS
jgi:hypothetical protein